MADINRRQALSLGFAAATMAVLPASAKLAPIEAIAPAAPTPSWIVGTPGEYDWQHIVAKTEFEARRIFVQEWKCYGEHCQHSEYQEDCEFCETLHSSEVQRMEAWDGHNEVSSADWLKQGLGTLCDRCANECHRDCGAHIVGSDAVCEDCMTLADWDLVDPTTAAEMRAEMEDDEDAPALFGDNGGSNG